MNPFVYYKLVTTPQYKLLFTQVTPKQGITKDMIEEDWLQVWAKDNPAVAKMITNFDLTL